MEPLLSEALRLLVSEPLPEERLLDELGVDPEDGRDVSEPLEAELRLPESLLRDPLPEPLDPSDRLSELSDWLLDFDDSDDLLLLSDWLPDFDDSEDPLRLFDDEELDDDSLTDENDLLEP